MKKITFMSLVIYWTFGVFQVTYTRASTIDLSTLGGIIAYESYEQGSAGIYVMQPDGDGKKKITDNLMSYGSPFISYDGKKVVYYGGSSPSNTNIYVSNIDGSSTLQVIANGFQNSEPVFSPDGTWITYDNNTQWKLSKMPVTGGTPSILMDHGRFSHWSPDGTKIAAMLWDERDIYIMNSDGSDLTLIAESPGYMNSYPRWSPDGTQIAYFSNKDGTSDIWVMDPDGGNAHNLLTGYGWDNSYESYFSWSPDGQYMVVESDRSGNHDLWIFEVANPSNMGQITDSLSLDGMPSWQVSEPDPIQEILAFIEKSVADGNLVPVKTGKAGEGQLGALINMIETAGNLIDANDPNLLSDICGQLNAALGKTDGQEQPPDFVTGEAAAGLAQRIQELMVSLGCE